VPDKIHTDIFVEHIPYEIDMLRETYRMLAAVPPPTDALKNALIEAFCVHARSLLDFFKSTSTNTNDAVATEFATGYVPQIDETVDPLKTIRLKLNKQIFHLTKDRTIVNVEKFDPGIDGPEVVNTIETELARFVGFIRPEFGQFRCKSQPIPFVHTPPTLGPSSHTSSLSATIPTTGPTGPIQPR
jgi:hypothetical protein